MQYRAFGKSGERVSALGFGCMRLPLTNPAKPESIDIVQVRKMVDYAIEHGINYYDTAYGYHEQRSEPVMGEILEGLRQKILLATKLPVWFVNEQKDMERLLQEQMRRLRTDYLDMYLLHALNAKSFQSIQSFDVFSFLDQKKKEGAIRFAGFSFHDELPVFKEIIDAYNWDFCQIQLNYMDTNYQAGIEGLHYAASKGIAVIIMEPLKGGKLSLPPASVWEIFQASNRVWSPTEWAFRWLGNFKDVHLILSGMNNQNQLEENVKTFDSVKPQQLTEEDLFVVGKVIDALQSIKSISCTRCLYCMPCPHGVHIPDNFDVYNSAFLFNQKRDSRITYQKFMAERKRASSCIACGECVPKCPQQLPIPDLMKDVHDFLSQPIEEKPS